MAARLFTERLSLSAIGMADIDVVHTILGDPLTNTVGAGAHATVAETAAWVGRRAAVRRTHGLCWYLLTEVATDDVVGTCGIFPGRTGPAEPEIGFGISHLRRRRGLAADAAGAVLGACWTAGIGAVWATVRPANEASLRIVDSLSFRRVEVREDEKGPLLFLRADAGSRAP